MEKNSKKHFSFEGEKLAGKNMDFSADKVTAESQAISSACMIATEGMYRSAHLEYHRLLIGQKQ